MIAVVMLVAVLALVGVSLLELLRLDLSLVGQSRKNLEAREVAEGAVMEVVNDLDTPSLLPSIGDGSLTNDYAPRPDSPFSDPVSRRDYSARVSLLRVAPLGESSHAWSRALVYEVEVTAKINDGESTAEVRSEVFKTVAFEPGIVLPRRHYR